MTQPQPGDHAEHRRGERRAEQDSRDRLGERGGSLTAVLVGKGGA
jgi:hypothetical protein